MANKESDEKTEEIPLDKIKPDFIVDLDFEKSDFVKSNKLQKKAKEIKRNRKRRQHSLTVSGSSSSVSFENNYSLDLENASVPLDLEHENISDFSSTKGVIMLNAKPKRDEIEIL